MISDRGKIDVYSSYLLSLCRCPIKEPRRGVHDRLLVRFGPRQLGGEPTFAEDEDAVADGEEFG